MKCLALILLFLSGQASATTAAWWRFNTAQTLLYDWSGGGNTLEQGGTLASTTTSPPEGDRWAGPTTAVNYGKFPAAALEAVFPNGAFVGTIAGYFKPGGNNTFFDIRTGANVGVTTFQMYPGTGFETYISRQSDGTPLGGGVQTSLIPSAGTTYQIVIRGRNTGVTYDIDGVTKLTIAGCNPCGWRTNAAAFSSRNVGLRSDGIWDGGTFDMLMISSDPDATWPPTDPSPATTIPNPRGIKIRNGLRLRLGWLLDFFTSPLYGQSQDQLQETSFAKHLLFKNKSQQQVKKDQQDAAKLADDIIKGRVTLTPTPTRTPVVTATRTPVS